MEIQRNVHRELVIIFAEHTCSLLTCHTSKFHGRFYFFFCSLYRLTTIAATVATSCSYHRSHWNFDRCFSFFVRSKKAEKKKLCLNFRRRLCWFRLRFGVNVKRIFLFRNFILFDYFFFFTWLWLQFCWFI